MQSNTKYPILSLKRLRERNLQLTCHYTTFYRRYKRNYAQIMAEINAASTSTEAVSHAVFPVEVEPSSVNTDSMNNEIEVVPSTPCTSVTPCASTSEICTQVSSERDELTNMLLLRQLCQSSAFLHSIAKRTNKTKNYAVLRKAGSKELFIAAKSWMLSEDLCLYHSSITDNEVEACVRPRPEWVLTDCEMLAELDSFVEAKNTLQATKRIYSVLSNSDNMEETLPLTNSKRPRVETKNSSYAYDSMELEAVEAQKVCLPSKYPTTNFMATVMSPIASTSTQQMPVATSSPIAQLVQQTTKENCELDNKVANELQSIRGKCSPLKEKCILLKEK
uniref:Uncharacterized protein n=1 Tax=Trichobilharzia regenti TaxID=157069 RepID=A0AA85J683_TRIRE|nr:unnamed protein product [Trichobilharzia regenti]